MTTENARYPEADVRRVAAAFESFCDGLPLEQQPIMQAFLNRVTAGVEVS